MVDETGNGGETDDSTPAPVELGVADDHVAAFTKARKPIIAIEELVWNALDADAENISVELDFTKLGGLDWILVHDDGHGMDPAEREQSFGNLVVRRSVRRRRRPAVAPCMASRARADSEPSRWATSWSG